MNYLKGHGVGVLGGEGLVGKGLASLWKRFAGMEREWYYNGSGLGMPDWLMLERCKQV